MKATFGGTRCVSQRATHDMEKHPHKEKRSFQARARPVFTPLSPVSDVLLAGAHHYLFKPSVINAPVYRSRLIHGIPALPLA
ncbi:MAG TPA: hypothetical protein VJ577_20405 [Burkholderiaceae bacterium]|nr:hypothetical protein [Burkholderiaceae bacterium]